MRSLVGIHVLAFAASVLTGCGKSEDALVPVTGRVIVNSKPANGAAVVFHPADGANDTHPVAQVDAGGEFRLTTIRSGDGAVPGEYRVTLTWYTSRLGKKGVEGEEGPVRNLIPDKYARIESTPISTTVRPEGNDPLRIEIKTRN